MRKFVTPRRILRVLGVGVPSTVILCTTIHLLTVARCGYAVCAHAETSGDALLFWLIAAVIAMLFGFVLDNVISFVEVERDDLGFVARVLALPLLVGAVLTPLVHVGLKSYLILPDGASPLVLPEPSAWITSAGISFSAACLATFLVVIGVVTIANLRDRRAGTR